jgi:hypothetical protein
VEEHGESVKGEAGNGQRETESGIRNQESQKLCSTGSSRRCGTRAS